MAGEAIMIWGGSQRVVDIEYKQFQSQSIEAGAMERVKYGVTLSQLTHIYLTIYFWQMRRAQALFE